VATLVRSVAIAHLAVLSLGAPVLAQSAAEPVALVVAAGRPLRVALDKRIAVTRVGQPVAATLIEPIYAYDRLVIPAGVAVLGHIAALQDASRAARVQALLSGNFSPHRGVVLQFDTIGSPRPTGRATPETRTKLLSAIGRDRPWPALGRRRRSGRATPSPSSGSRAGWSG
jgi:hypothetical protein